MNSPEKHPTLTVGEFYTRHSEALQIKPLTEHEVGFERRIREPTVNRPGLALAGFYKYFAFKRVQVLGNSELSYLEDLGKQTRRNRFEGLCKWDIPCIVIARGRAVPEDLVEIANARSICVFQTSMVTMKFINLATIRLDWAFSPSTTVHGSMVDVQAEFAVRSLRQPSEDSLACSVKDSVGAFQIIEELLSLGPEFFCAVRD